MAAGWNYGGRIRPENIDLDDGFGQKVKIYDDTMIVAAPLEDSNQTTITTGDSADNSKFDSGAVYVYYKNAGLWELQAYIKASNADEEDYFGDVIDIGKDKIVVGFFILHTIFALAALGGFILKDIALNAMFFKQ